MQKTEKERRKERTANGICYICCKPTDRPGKICSQCFLRHKPRYAKRAKERNGKLRAKGLCHRCMKPCETKGTQCNSCKDVHKEEEKRRYSERLSAGLCVRCGSNPASPGKKRCDECNAFGNRVVKEYGKQSVQIVLAAYGAKCACCGETSLLFLTLDHVNNDGYKDRPNRSNSSVKLYRKVIREGFPPKYQILCYNCNCGRACNGGVCPHKQV